LICYFDLTSNGNAKLFIFYFISSRIFPVALHAAIRHDHASDSESQTVSLQFYTATPTCRQQPAYFVPAFPAFYSSEFPHWHFASY